MSSRKIEIDSELIDQLSKLLDSNNLTEIEVQHGDQRVRVARGVPGARGFRRGRFRLGSGRRFGGGAFLRR